jgi:hypothetical protein
MPFFSADASRGPAALTRPLITGLFVATCLLSIVSWYTTQRGMALYLSEWFSLLASIGLQTALVLVAWLIGLTRARRALLIAVYVVTATVSIAFSYVALYSWFSAKERPVAIERRLYDTLNDAAGQAQSTLAAAISEGQKHVLALEELTAAEKTHGFVSRAQDADPYLERVRQAVAQEARTYAENYKEGSGPGVRYSAFDRYTQMARQSLERLQAAQRVLAEFRSQLKPMDPTEQQLKSFRQVYDTIPWSDAEATLHAARFERPAVPAYENFVDRTASGQEDLLVAFQELFSAPTYRHAFALLLAAFIDVVVFLLAYASGPHLLGSPEQRWVAAGAALESLDDQVFVRGFLSKVGPGLRGMARVEASALNPGEMQLCLLLASHRLAATVEEDGRLVYLLDPDLHQQLVESLSVPGLPLRASAPQQA